MGFRYHLCKCEKRGIFMNPALGMGGHRLLRGTFRSRDIMRWKQDLERNVAFKGLGLRICIFGVYNHTNVWN